ncbi:MAG: glycerol-3-phosphate 1-O-acyltransferase PlsY [Eubacterium sp.]
MIGLKLAVIAVISYLLGSLNFSIIFSKFIVKEDIRKSGSGNAGATNMLRTYGKKFAVITMLGDILKVAAAVIIAFLILDVPLEYLFKLPNGNNDSIINFTLYKVFAGFFCVLGHIFPLYFNFKGGKGVAACTGMVILVDWRIALILFVIFMAVIFISRWISLGSIIISILYPVLIYVFFRDIKITLVAVLFTAIVIVSHRENIKRIFNGTENKISFNKKDKKE